MLARPPSRTERRSAGTRTGPGWAGLGGRSVPWLSSSALIAFDEGVGRMAGVGVVVGAGGEGAGHDDSGVNAEAGQLGGVADGESVLGRLSGEVGREVGRGGRRGRCGSLPTSGARRAVRAGAAGRRG
jgi:hypothetical protein